MSLEDHEYLSQLIREGKHHKMVNYLKELGKDNEMIYTIAAFEATQGAYRRSLRNIFAVTPSDYNWNLYFQLLEEYLENSLFDVDERLDIINMVLKAAGNRLPVISNHMLEMREKLEIEEDI